MSAVPAELPEQIVELFIYEHEPRIQWDLEEFDKFLLWAVDNNASDVAIYSGNTVKARIHGEWLQVTNRDVMTNELEKLLHQITRTNNATAKLQGGLDADFRHEIKRDRFSSVAFRVNATAIKYGWSLGISITFRTIPSVPPHIDDLDVEDGIMKSAFPLSGLILATGVMGSGKSTLLASMLRHIIETQPRHVITYEDPIEFDLMNFENAKGFCVQSEIGTHLREFEMAPANAARRAADVILIGEAREANTLRKMLEAAEIGVAAYATLHTRSVAEAPARIINTFPHEIQRQMAVTLLSSLRLIVQQRLVAKEGGGRIALREFLEFDNYIREELMRVPIDGLILKLKEFTVSRGQPMIDDATRKFKEGLISRETYNVLLQEFV
jgi:defect-in-organelle-trafficking protein DotB